MDGLTLSYGRSDLNSAQANGTEEQIAVSYAVGGVTVMWAHDMSADDDASGGTDYDARSYGISFAVNDDLTVTWDQSSADKSGSTVDEDTTSIQASYTMGSMTIKGHISKADNAGFVSDAEDNRKLLLYLGHSNIRYFKYLKAPNFWGLFFEKTYSRNTHKFSHR